MIISHLNHLKINVIESNDIYIYYGINIFQYVFLLIIDQIEIFVQNLCMIDYLMMNESKMKYSSEGFIFERESNLRKTDKTVYKYSEKKQIN